MDETLLHSDERTSEITNHTINDLVDRGMLFSYATARSFHTAHKATKGLNAKIPLMIYIWTDIRFIRLFMRLSLVRNNFLLLTNEIRQGCRNTSTQENHCERWIAFGDGRNDIDLFEIADEVYAVAKWLLNNFA